MFDLSKKGLKTNFYNYIYLLLFFLFLFTRLYQFGNVPYGLHVDEAGMAYDAWSLSQYGVDRYLNSFPVYLINFGGGQSALYAYSSAIFIKFFGLNMITIRFPGFVFSVLGLIYGLKIIELIYPHKNMPKVLMIFLYSIFPYHIMQARFGLDCNLMMGLTAPVLYYFNQMYLKPNKANYFFAGIFTGITLYSYALSFFVLPIFILLFFTYCLINKKLTWKYLLYYGVPVGILAFPLILMIYINTFQLDSIKIGILTVPRLLDYRGGELSLSNVYGNFKVVIKSILLYDWLPYNAFPVYFTMYVVSIPFVVYSTIVIFKRHILKNIYNPMVVIWFFSFSVFFMGLFLNGDPNTGQLNGIFIAMLVFVVFGITDSVSLIKSEKLKRISMFLLFFIYLIFFYSFSKEYWQNYSHNKSQNMFTFLMTEELDYINQRTDLNNFQIYTESNYAGYIYYLLSTKTSPFEFDIENQRLDFNNYHFYLPEKPTPNNMYVVWKTNYWFNHYAEEYIGEMERIEFTDYYIYIVKK